MILLQCREGADGTSQEAILKRELSERDAEGRAWSGAPLEVDLAETFEKVQLRVAQIQAKNFNSQSMF